MLVIEKAFYMPTKIMGAKDVAALKTLLPIGPDDLILTEDRLLDVLNLVPGTRVLLRDEYGRGPNSDAVIKQVCEDAGSSYKRVIGIGGGAVLDLAKLLSLEKTLPVRSLFDSGANLRKVRKLVLIPTTPGTGSEVTPYCAVYFDEIGQQLVLNHPALYADCAILCPEFLNDIPFNVFAASSFDAFTHAFESYLSALATPASRAISLEALKNLVICWQDIARRGVSSLNENLASVQIAGNMAGIGYANAGCAAVHALAYPLCTRLHIHHGEANYLVFKAVCELYAKKKPAGALDDIRELFAALFSCSRDDAFAAFDRMCLTLLPRRRLSAIGMNESQVLEFTDMVMTRQHMLIANGYTQLTAGEISYLYQSLL